MPIDGTSEITITNIDFSGCFGTKNLHGSSSYTCAEGGAVSCSRRLPVWIYALS